MAGEQVAGSGRIDGEAGVDGSEAGAAVGASAVSSRAGREGSPAAGATEGAGSPAAGASRASGAGSPAADATEGAGSPAAGASRASGAGSPTADATEGAGEAAPFLEVSGLCKHYGEGDTRVAVLEDITTSVGAGEVCVLLGPSGSGKSTFLNLVGGLEPADAGSIRVGGTELTGLSDKELGEYRRRQLGFVFQFYNLVPDLTIRENIEVCQHLSRNPLPMDDLLRSLGLWEHRNKFPRQVSGGQQQRCAIGRALVKNPGLLLCDEPTGALDYQTSKEILELMEQVNRQYGCTVVIVTHNGAIKHMAHRILRLRDGVLVQDVRNDCVLPAAQLEW